MDGLFWPNVRAFILLKTYKIQTTGPLVLLRLMYDFNKTLEVFLRLPYEFNNPLEAFCSFGLNFYHQELSFFPIQITVTIRA